MHACKLQYHLGSRLSFQGSALAGLDRPVTNAALEFKMRPVNYGLNSTLALTCGFAHALMSDASDASPSPVWHFAVALWSNLPADLPVAAVKVCLPRQACTSLCTTCNFNPHVAQAFLPVPCTIVLEVVSRRKSMSGMLREPHIRVCIAGLPLFHLIWRIQQC